MIEVSRVANARVWINGTDFIGRADEVDLPKVRHKTIDMKGLGMFGETDLNILLDKMEARFKFNSTYSDFVKYASDPFKVNTVIVRAPILVYSQNDTKTKSLKAELRGIFKEFDTGKFRKGDPTEVEAIMAVHYYRLEVDGEEVYEIDVFNNVYKVGGEDKLAEYRQAMGG